MADRSIRKGNGEGNLTVGPQAIHIDVEDVYVTHLANWYLCE